jgi:hypothetical protein
VFINSKWRKIRRRSENTGTPLHCSEEEEFGPSGQRIPRVRKEIADADTGSLTYSRILKVSEEETNGASSSDDS